MWVFILIGIVLVSISGYLLLTQKKGGNKTSEEQIIAVQSKVTDEDNRFRAGKETKAATARTEARQVGNMEAQEIVRATVIQTANVQAEFDLKEAPHRALETRKKEQSEHDLFIALLNEAKEDNISVEALIEVKKKRLLDEAERTHQAQLGQQAIRLGLIARHLQDHQAINQIQIQLDGLYVQMADIEGRVQRGELPASAGRAMIADRKKTITTIKKDKNGREQRLLQAYNGKNAQRVDKDTNLR